MKFPKWFPRYSRNYVDRVLGAQAEETAEMFERMRQRLFLKYYEQPDHFKNMCIRSGYEVHLGEGQMAMIETNVGGTLEQ